MDLKDYQPLDGEALKEKIRSLPRSELDEQIRRFGTQYALLCERLEALYSPGREDQFWAIRPGGLDEIDQAIQQTGPDNPKELALLKAFRELNRVLLPFMDVYEERVLEDVTSMSQDELNSHDAAVSEQLASATRAQKLGLADLRQAQNASGTLRLAALMKDAIRRELKKRSGSEPE